MGVLTKITSVNFDPGDPGRPAQPARVVTTCETYKVMVTRVQWGGYVQSPPKWVGELQGNLYRQRRAQQTYFRLMLGAGRHPRAFVIKTFETRQRNCTFTTIPAEPAIPPTPGTATTTALAGWDGGARSIALLPMSGGVRFSVPKSVIGVFVGFAAHDNSTDYAELTHAIHFSRGTFSIYENGHPVGVTGSYDTSDTFEIRRVDGVVTYYQDSV